VDSVDESAGIVLDGGGQEDYEFTDEVTAVTTRFYDFSSTTCGGITGYEWAVGQGVEGVARESVLPFTTRGLTDNGDGSGHAQLPVAGLRELTNQRLYITVRGITGCGGMLESTSDGFIIDTTPPSLEFIATGYQAIEHAQSTGGNVEQERYQSSDLFSAVWEAADAQSYIPDDVIVQVGTFPGGSDVSQGRRVSGNDLRERISVPEGQPTYVTLSAVNGAGLESIAISEPITMDTTPPLTGEVSQF
jgi:hypothetical protein